MLEGGGGGGGGETCPPIFLKLLRVSKKKCLVPPEYRITNGASPNPKVAPRSLFVGHNI